jgi:hypothetical protein
VRPAFSFRLDDEGARLPLRRRRVTGPATAAQNVQAKPFVWAKRNPGYYLLRRWVHGVDRDDIDHRTLDETFARRDDHECGEGCTEPGEHSTLVGRRSRRSLIAHAARLSE